MRAWLALPLSLLACAPLHAQTVYRCATPTGVVYSERPCAPDAEKRVLQPPGPARAVAGAAIDPRALDEVMFGMSERDIIERIGRPAGIYRIVEEQYWLYPNACRLSGQQRVCAELLVRDGASQQVNWIAEGTMRKSVQIAKSFGDWQPPKTPPERRFTLESVALAGQSRGTVAHRHGPPDVKKVHNGVEVWEYRNVPRSRTDTTPLTLYIEFDGDKVARTMGN